jgi:hypothetical protein
MAMPYSLQATDYVIVKDGCSSFDASSVIVSLQGEPGCQCIHLYTQEDYVELALEQWPLIIEAVDKLLNKGSAAMMQPEVSLKFLEQIGFNLEAACEVLNGNLNSLFGTMIWMQTDQGVDYWLNRRNGKKPLSSEDKALLQSWIDAARHYGL